MSDDTRPAEPKPPTVIGPAASGVAKAGTAPVALVLDLNANNVPDYKEPFFWRGVLGVFSWFAGTFAAPHTIAGKLAREYRDKVVPELQKPSGERFR
jgi:hypothetical protein